MKSKVLARAIFQNLVKGLGVDCAVVCAGARNAPLVKALEESGLECFHFFHENSAGFFALGLAKKGRKPVVLCTSGTAVAQLLSPCIEAFYDDRFMVFLTADRPKSYRDSGAPQSIKQNNIFKDFVSVGLDIDDPTEIVKLEFSNSKPVHINVCLDNPLWWEDANTGNETEVVWSLQDKAFSEITPTIKLHAKASILVASRLSKKEANNLRAFLQKQSGLSIYLEASSCLLREEFSDRHHVIYSEQELVSIFEKQKVSQILHLGGVPTNKLWRLIAEDDLLQVDSIGSGPFSGLLHAKRYQTELTESFLDSIVVEGNKDIQNERSDIFESFVADFPQSEAALYPRIKSCIKETDFVYVGNSMPIRYYDMGRIPQCLAFDCNRGVNGIDGQLSSFLGASPKAAKRAICILGDLTFFYELSALWAAKYSECENICIVVVNNAGGKIFDRVFPRNPFANPHDYSFEKIAEFYSFSYLKNPPDKLPEKGKWIVELNPDEEATNLFHKEWDAQWI